MRTETEIRKRLEARLQFIKKFPESREWAYERVKELRWVLSKKAGKENIYLE